MPRTRKNFFSRALGKTPTCGSKKTKFEWISLQHWEQPHVWGCEEEKKLKKSQNHSNICGEKCIFVAKL